MVSLDLQKIAETPFVSFIQTSMLNLLESLFLI